MEYTLADNKIMRMESKTAMAPEKSWWPVVWLPMDIGLRREVIERLTNPLYGREILDEQLGELAVTAPGISQVWKITESWPSLTKLLLEDRNNE